MSLAKIMLSLIISAFLKRGLISSFVPVMPIFIFSFLTLLLYVLAGLTER